MCNLDSRRKLFSVLGFLFYGRFMTNIPSQVLVADSDRGSQVMLFSFEPVLDVVRDHALLLLVVALVVAFLGRAKVEGWFSFRASMGVGCTWFVGAVVFALGVLTVWL